MTSDGLTEKEEQRLIELINKLGKRWSNELYKAIAPKFALTAIETVFFQKISNNELFVALHKRPDNDIPQWAGRPASPGSMLRSSDKPGSYEDAVIRIRQEFGGKDFWSRRKLRITPRPVDVLFQHTDRGPENALIFVCHLEGNLPENWRYYLVNHLPEDILSHHVPIIYAAAQYHDAAKDVY